MKAIVLLCTFALLGYCNAQLPAATKACTAELKLPEKDVTDFYATAGKLESAPAPMQCHMKCVMEKLGQLKAGVLDVEKTAKDFKEIPELAEARITDPKVFTTCKNEKGANDCETAFKIYKCIKQNKAAK